jgi:hypothetical protein
MVESQKVLVDMIGRNKITIVEWRVQLMVAMKVWTNGCKIGYQDSRNDIYVDLSVLY